MDNYFIEQQILSKKNIAVSPDPKSGSKDKDKL